MNNDIFTTQPNQIDDPSIGPYNPDDCNLARQQAFRYAQYTAHRKRLITWIMWIIPVWLVAVLLITAFGSDVSETVKVTLLATTTINVIGLALVVLKGMFGNE